MNSFGLKAIILNNDCHVDGGEQYGGGGVMLRMKTIEKNENANKCGNERFHKRRCDIQMKETKASISYY
jgi:hypothetical protein